MHYCFKGGSSNRYRGRHPIAKTPFLHLHDEQKDADEDDPVVSGIINGMQICELCVMALLIDVRDDKRLYKEGKPLLTLFVYAWWNHILG